MFWTKTEDGQFYHFILKSWGKIANFVFILVFIVVQIFLESFGRALEHQAPGSGSALPSVAFWFLVFIPFILLIILFVGNGSVIKYTWRNRFNGKKLINSGGLKAWFSNGEVKVSAEK